MIKDDLAPSPLPPAYAKIHVSPFIRQVQCESQKKGPMGEREGSQRIKEERQELFWHSLSLGGRMTICHVNKIVHSNGALSLSTSLGGTD